jgi:hypothetical protein
MVMRPGFLTAMLKLENKSMVWKHSGLPKPKIQTNFSWQKAKCSCFWDRKGVQLVAA